MLRIGRGISLFSASKIICALFISCMSAVSLYSQAISASVYDSGWISDPIEDDHGFGGLVYPEGVLAGSGDIVAVRFVSDEDKVHCQIKMREWDPASRIAIALLDVNAMSESDFEFTIGGTELMVPYWLDHGIHALIAGPNSSLYDYNVEVENPAGQPRPDNAVYIYHDPTLWLGENGNASKDPTDVYRLDVVQERLEGESASWVLTVPLKREVLEKFLTFKGDEPVIYAAVMSYFVTTGGETEYGAHEVSSQLGGHDSWEDPDVYDIAFAENQADLLKPKIDQTGKYKMSELKGESEGFFKVRLPWSRP